MRLVLYSVIMSSFVATAAGGMVYYYPSYQQPGALLPPASIIPIVPMSLVHDVPYYTGHATERREKTTWCSNNPGLARDDVNCLAAQQAAWNVAFDAELNVAAAHGVRPRR